jgi:predicted RNA methylase
MVSDRSRVGPFRQAIERVCAGKVVLESGTGSAILSLLAGASVTIRRQPPAVHARASF